MTESINSLLERTFKKYCSDNKISGSGSATGQTSSQVDQATDSSVFNSLIFFSASDRLSQTPNIAIQSVRSPLPIESPVFGFSDSSLNSGSERLRSFEDADRAILA